MNLPIFRQLSYISPSTFLKWRKCQYAVYLGKQSGLPWEPSLGGNAAQIGNAIDAFIKEWVVRKRKMDCPIVHLDRMLKGITPENVEIGKGIVRQFVTSPLAQELLVFREIKLDQELYCNSGSLPILGRLDFIVEGMPGDFKSRGFASVKPTTPTKGATRTFKVHGDNHWYDTKAKEFVPLEEANPDWATQITFYNWLLKNTANTYLIYELTNTCDGLVVSELKGDISKEFEKTIRHELSIMWECLTDQLYYSRINIPSPNKFICEEYGSVCDQAHNCSYYKNTLGDAERRVYLV